MDSGLKLWGIMTTTAIVLPNATPTLVKAAARLAKVVFGSRIQICDGANDEVQVNAAIAVGGRTLILDGTLTIDANITPLSNTALLGLGNVTILDFNTACRIDILNKDNIELGGFKITGDTNATEAAVWIGCDTGDHSGYYIHDIWCTVLGGDHFELYPNAYTLSNARFERCFADSPDGFGFIIGGEDVGAAVSGVTYIGCDVKNAGVAATRITDWITGFDFCEHAGLTITDINAIDCSVDGAWESCFHFETVPAKNGVHLIGCYAKDAGQKGAPTFGAGYLVGGGDITLTDCYATGSSKADFFCMGNANSQVTLINPISENSSGDGLLISSHTSGKLYVHGGLMKTSAKYGIQIAGAKNLYIDGLVVDTPTGVSNIGNYIGRTPETTCDDSFLNIHFRGTCSTEEVAFYDCDNLEVRGSVISTATSMAVYIHDVTNSRFSDYHVENTGEGGAGIGIIDGAVVDRLTFDGGKVVSDGHAIWISQGTDCVVRNMDLIASAGNPIEANFAAVVRLVIMGNSWEGSLNDLSLAAAVNPRITNNIDKDGAWYAGDNPA